MSSRSPAPWPGRGRVRAADHGTVGHQQPARCPPTPPRPCRAPRRTAVGGQRRLEDRRCGEHAPGGQRVVVAGAPNAGDRPQKCSAAVDHLHGRGARGAGAEAAGWHCRKPEDRSSTARRPAVRLGQHRLDAAGAGRGGEMVGMPLESRRGPTRLRRSVLLVRVPPRPGRGRCVDGMIAFIPLPVEAETTARGVLGHLSKPHTPSCLALAWAGAEQTSAVEGSSRRVAPTPLTIPTRTRGQWTGTGDRIDGAARTARVGGIGGPMWDPQAERDVGRDGPDYRPGDGRHDRRLARAAPVTREPGR